MNSLKRVVVITISVLYFRNAVSGLNGLGICLALGGVLLYERSVRVPVGEGGGGGGALSGLAGGSGGAASFAATQHLLPRLGSDLQLVDYDAAEERQRDDEGGLQSPVAKDGRFSNGWLEQNERLTSIA